MDWIDELAWKIVVEQNVLRRSLEFKDYEPLRDMIRKAVAENVGEVVAEKLAA